jgi:uncharacterized protein YqjF (DUF2071 family)
MPGYVSFVSLPGERGTIEECPSWQAFRLLRHRCRGPCSPISTGPFPLHAVEVVDLDDDLVAAGGVQPTGARLRALFSPGVRARFGRPTHMTNL